MRLCCDSLRSCPALPQQTVFSFACLLRLPPHPRPNNPTHTDNSLSKHNTHMSTAILHAPATIPRLCLPPPPPPLAAAGRVCCRDHQQLELHAAGLLPHRGKQC
jgi:hypothetical protein